MTRVYVAVGSNVEPEKNLAAAWRALSARWPGAVVSSVYRSAPVGFDGDDFLNCVVGFDTAEPLAAVLEQLHAIEAQCGRPRSAPQYGPRRMDLDVLLFGDLRGEFPGAVLPRPDLLRRAYMLGPLAEIAPDLQHPTAGQTIGELWRRFDRAAHPLTRVAVPGLPMRPATVRASDAV
ncbi:MAG: 2-amino-4-hydroxy-6-hydroxymethyldihydropteridine diphosphokinase [Steroidobacteraceae bacterium]|nr:2-amino-4-hydroxy-6-hydroxymethyldihydropteridine diphosphokinase [Steroidobacteraceae bacterium]MDW8259342.1 2-amino-4-hydroxy-6-hydroxymethyldihydropteridine diphosphokinase [Gammaproteobacteria bacterium]